MSESQPKRVVRDPNASLDWMRQIQTQQRAGEHENSTLRQIYKRAKNSGENVGAMRKVIRMLRSQSPEEIITELRDQIAYLQMRRVDIIPTDLFDGSNMPITEKTARADDMWDAGEKGYGAGRLGAKIEDCPYDPGTELHVEWIKNWQAGQAAIAREMGPDAKVASASRGRPRRGDQGRIPGTETKLQAPRKAGRPKGAAKKGKAPSKAGKGGRRALPEPEVPSVFN